MTQVRPVRRVLLWGAALLLFSCVLLLAPAGADDVSAAAREAYETARRLHDKGDAKSLAEALAALEARRDDAPASIDFWTLYARVWVALERDPNEFWSGVVAERQQAAPNAVVFDLARARVETTTEKRRAAVESALRRDARSIPARTAMGMLLIEEKEEDAGAELLEEILEEDEHCLGALLAMARLELSDGMPADALSWCKTALEEHQSPEVHHLMALCYQRMALNDHEAVKQALASATEAMGLEPTQERITLYSELLKQTGDAATAAKALRTHFERTQHPLLGALLAESAFRAGDYEAALLGLSAGEGSDLVTLKGLASAHARLGHQKEAQAAADKLMTVDSHGTLFAARLDLFLGDAASATRRLGALADPEALGLRALAHAWRGESAEVKKLVAKEVATGSREGEALLVAWLQAELLSRMDADLADAVRKKLLEARFAAGAQLLAQANPHEVDLGNAVSAGWPLRALTWFRSRCGSFFQPTGDGVGMHMTMGDGGPSKMSSSVSGEAACGSEKDSCTFTFNARETKSIEGFFRVLEEDTIELKDFAPAEQAFAAGCKAFAAGKGAEVEGHFRRALDIEPNWNRISALLAVMRALRSGEERRADAREAAEAAKTWTDDFELRRLVIYLRAWAGDAELEAEIKDLAQREAQYSVRNLSAL